MIIWEISYHCLISISKKAFDGLFFFFFFFNYLFTNRIIL